MKCEHFFGEYNPLTVPLSGIDLRSLSLYFFCSPLLVNTNTRVLEFLTQQHHVHQPSTVSARATDRYHVVETHALRWVSSDVRRSKLRNLSRVHVVTA